MDPPTVINTDEDRRRIGVFMRQYLQMIDPAELTYPPGQLIKSVDVQSFLVDHMFDRRRWRLPPARYSFRVLKKLISIITVAISNPEEDELSDKLMYFFSLELAASGKGSVQEKCAVIYTAPCPNVAPQLTIFEAPYLLASGGNTGQRTWTAALYLASYLFRDGRQYVENRNILELGAGVGFLSIFCAKHLGAKHVLMTDSSDAVMTLAQENVEENKVDQIVKTEILRWGDSCVDDILQRGQNGCDAMQYDVVLAADILYDPQDFPALMSTLGHLFRRWPQLQVLVSTAIRTESTFKSFVDACRK
ncbi:MAG: hypothetical protein LQ345_000765 [Seirophora villosa]|nr:MAG: hypothetical protein LQ345_000765 [Seirophora villosa]